MAATSSCFNESPPGGGGEGGPRPMTTTPPSENHGFQRKYPRIMGACPRFRRKNSELGVLVSGGGGQKVCQRPLDHPTPLTKTTPSRDRGDYDCKVLRTGIRAPGDEQASTRAPQAWVPGHWKGLNCLVWVFVAARWDLGEIAQDPREITQDSFEMTQNSRRI